MWQSVLVVLYLVGATSARPPGALLLNSWAYDNSLRPGTPAFQADYEEVSKRGPSETDRGRIYVGADGRARVDTFGDPTFSMIWDPRNETGAMVDLATREVLMRFPEDTPTAEDGATTGHTPLPRRMAVTKQKPYTKQDLGERVIEGLKCRGFLVTTEIQSPDHEATRERYTIETWVSSRLNQVVFEHRKSAREDVTLRLSNIKFGEPDPALFVVPRDAGAK